MICDQYRSKYMVLRNSENYNLGGSHKIGLNYALENEYTHLAICHGDDQANGLSFSVNEGIRVPPSLRNILKEMNNDLGINITFIFGKNSF